MIKTMQKRIEEIKQADRKAYYELANEIGISEYSLYNFMINKYSTNTEEKINKFLKDYKTKDEQIAQWKHEYEVLDACCELAQGKIEELKADNERLKRKNDELHSIIRKKKEQLKTVNYMLFEEKDMTKNEWKLRYKCAQKDRRYQSYRYMAKKYKTYLQEIKAIAEKLMADNLCNNCDGIGLDANCQDIGCPYYQMDKILQKITKAEEE